jgi:hypothetical protein
LLLTLVCNTMSKSPDPAVEVVWLPARLSRQLGLAPGRATGPSASRLEYVKMTYELNGRLDGWTATLWLVLRGDEIVVAGGPTFSPPPGLTLAEASNRALREFRLGDVPKLLEERLEELRYPFELFRAGMPDDWVAALRRMHPRPGRRRTVDQVYELAAKRRVEAEGAAAGRAIGYMVERWPEDYVSDSAVHALLNRAARRGIYAKNPPRLLKEH